MGSFDSISHLPPSPHIRPRTQPLPHRKPREDKPDPRSRQQPQPDADDSDDEDFAGDDEDGATLGYHRRDLPRPDLCIRTGGDARISNFMLWHFAYSELYFTPTLWPDFGELEFARALSDYRRRERRFGLRGPDGIVAGGEDA